MDAVAHVLVPVKRLDDAKSRLSDVLDPAARAALMQELLAHVLAVVEEADIGPVTIVSQEPGHPNGMARFDDGGAAWNDALAAAIRAVVSDGRRRRAPADLPRLTAEDVRALVAATPELRNRHRSRPRRRHERRRHAPARGGLATHFGEQQQRRRSRADRLPRRLRRDLLDLPGLAFDVDTPDDLDELRRMGWPGRMSLTLGYKASAEQFGPRELLDFSVLAEQLGLDSIGVSDHFQPWRHAGGHSPAALAWLGAAGEGPSARCSARAC